MQTFKDSATGNVWSYEDDVIVSNNGGIRTFTSAHGVPLSAPATLQPFTLPGPSLTDQAATLLAQKITMGIVLTSTGTPALNATYALDATSTDQIFQMGLYADRFGKFPSGQATQAYPDISGTPHTFTVAQFVAFLQVVAPLVSALATQAGIMAHGGLPAWPAQNGSVA